MSKRRATGQRRAEKVLARRRRARGGAAGCRRAESAITTRPEPDEIGDRGEIGRPASLVPGNDDEQGDDPPAAETVDDPLDVFRRLNAVEFDEEVIGTILLVTTWITMDSGCPDLAETLSKRIDTIDREYHERVDAEHEEFSDGWSDLDPDESEPGPAVIARHLLIEFLREASRRNTGDDLAGRVVDWVSTELGRAGPCIDQQAIHLGGPGAQRPLDLARILEGHLLAVLIWLAGGLIAVSDDPEIVRMRRRYEDAGAA